MHLESISKGPRSKRQAMMAHYYRKQEEQKKLQENEVALEEESCRVSVHDCRFERDHLSGEAISLHS